MLMQAQFDEEHDIHISELEAKANRNRGNIRVSYDNFRSAHTFHDHDRRRVDPEYGASDDEFEQEEMEVTYVTLLTHPLRVLCICICGGQRTPSAPSRFGSKFPHLC